VTAHDKGLLPRVGVLVIRLIRRVGDLDEIQPLVKVLFVLSLPRCVQGEDRADRHVGNGGHAGVPRL
jgi:hypothetical protein